MLDKEYLINAYFENRLSEIERERFNDLLKTDDEFQEQFNFEKELQNSLRLEHRKELKTFLREADAKSNQSQRLPFNKKVWLVAASVVILLVSSFWIINNNSNNPTVENLYASYYQPYENVVYSIERGTRVDDLTSRAFLAYEQSDYRLAAKLFQQLSEEVTLDYIDFYQGIAMMELGENEKSISYLNHYLKSENPLSDRALWYLALNYLKLNNIDEAKKHLDRLIKLKTYNLSKAKELRQQLELF